MKNLWSKEDLANFGNSEVFSELETRVIETIKRADILSRKIAEAATAEEISAATKATKELTQATRELNTVMNQNDDQLGSEDDDAESEDSLDKVVEELTAMAKLAIDKGDYKLAYRVERTIDEIMELEVKCE